MTPRRPLASKRFIRTLVAVTVAFAALSLALPNIAPDVDFLAAPESPIREFFGVAEEMGVWAFISVVIFLMAAVLHGLSGLLVWAHDRKLGAAFATTALILTALAFDDFAALHELLADIGDAMGSVLPVHLRYAWVLPGVFLAAGCVYLFWILMRRLSGPPRRDLLVGLAIFFGAALGLEALNGVLDAPGTNGWQLQLGTHLEEVLENVGVIFLLRAAARTITVTGPSPLVLRYAPEATPWRGEGDEREPDGAVGSVPDRGLLRTPRPVGDDLATRGVTRSG
jgi:hypothetical protein